MTNETMTVTRLIPEEDLIDGLFYKCDKEKTGQVPVSRLIKYIQSTAGQDNESVAAIENLSTMLDPQGINKMIDLVSYRKGINQWIMEVRQNNNDSSSCDLTMQGNTLKRQNASLYYPDNLFSPVKQGERHNQHEEMNMSTSTIDNSIQDFSNQHFESEISELTTRVEDLQYQNRKLVEENAKLEQQLEGQEETMNNMNQEAVQLQRKIKSLQDLVDLRVETQEENEELKISLSKYHEKQRELDNRLNQYERENVLLQSQIEDYESKVQILSSELENANIQQKSLQSTLVEQKQLIRKLSEEKTMFEEEINEKHSQMENLQTYVEEVNKMNEEMKQEQENLQVQLIQAQQENTNFLMKDDQPNMSGSSGCVDDLDEVADNLQEERVSSSQSTACSTPVKQHSIHTEIKDVLGESLHLPSPLSDKELDESFRLRSNSSGGESWSTEDLVCFDVDSIVPSCGDGDTIKTLDASKLIDKFQEQQDVFKKQVNEIISAVEEKEQKPEKRNLARRLFTKSDHGDDRPVIQDQQDLEHDKYSEIRYKKLMMVLQKLKGENQRLVKVYDEAVESLTNWEKNVDSSVDKRLTVLRDILLEERALKKQHQQEVQYLKRKLDQSKHNLKEKEKVTQELQEELADLDIQLTQLRKANLDLAEKCHKSELKLSEVQEDILHSTFNLEREKHRNNELEDILANTKLARQLDLRDIWRLVQKDVEIECMEEQNDSPLSSSTDLLKEQISKEIECLKDSLVKRQAALGALKGKPMKLKLDSSGNYCQNMDISPSSPLVDALTIDFFNGNYPTGRQGNKRSSALSSLSQYSSLDRDSCSACQKNISAPSHHTLSCPSLHHRQYHPDPGFIDQHGMYSYNNLNTSSSSSTSGIDVSPRCSRSADGQSRRRDFIRSSIKYGSGSQTSAESNANSESSHPRQHKYSRSIGERLHKKDRGNVQSPAGFRRQSFTNAIENRKDSNENNVSQFSRSRSSSFQAAIERGRKSPVDEVDFISTSQESTPERSEYTSQYIQQEQYASSRHDGKSVSFHLSTEEFFEASEELPESDSRFQERNVDNQHEVSFSSQSPRSTVPVPTARKLSTLIEEDTDQAEPHSDKVITPQLIKSIVEEYATPTKQRAKKSKKGESEISANSKDPVGKKCEEISSSKTGEQQEKKEASPIKRKSQAASEEPSAKIKEKSIDKPSTLTEGGGISKTSNKKVSAKKIPVKAEETLFLPGSPENGMDTSRLSPTSSPKAKPLSRLAKLRQNNLAKKRDHKLTMNLPELWEQTEAETSIPQLLTMPENTLSPPPPTTDTKVTPSMPDEFLERLGLKPVGDEELVSAEDLPENEIERKFCSLALAYETDKQTLKKRKTIQERLRDLAEENIEKELHDVREATEELNKTVTDAKLREVIQRIQGHVEVLEQSAAKVSSKAEVFGAVQQEERLCTAMEVMVTYVSKLKTMYEKDHAELEEARKQLLDKPFGSQSFLEMGDRNRCMSMANLKDYPFFMDFKQHGGGSRDIVTDDEDPKQRFQALVGNTQMRNSVATTFRRGSLERQANVQPSKTPSISRENSADRRKELDGKSMVKKGSQEEEAYQKGFEDGIQAKVGKELTELRETQNHIGQNLEDIMDKVEKSKEEDEREKEEVAERRLMQLRALGLHKPSWENAGHTFRLALAGLIFMMAVGMVIMTIIPGSASGMDLHTNVQHFGAPPV